MDRVRTVEIRCDDHAENLILLRFDYDDEPPFYQFSIEDAYFDYHCTGLLGRFQRAWHAFLDKPISHAGIVVQDGKRLRKFLHACLDLAEE